MLVYRVENSAGEGMYSGDSAASQSMQDVNGSHPMPEDDGTLMRGLKQSKLRLWDFPSSFRYGFKDLDQLRLWVYHHEWREQLKDEGFVINVYECSEECYHGDTQAVFVKSLAKIVRTISLTEV